MRPDLSLLESNLKPDSTIKQTLETYKSAASSSAVKSRNPTKLNLDAAIFDIGFVVGRLIIDGFDCSAVRRGIEVPVNIDRVESMSSVGALFILLVQNDATYMELAEERFYNRFPCIIVRAGQPAVATQQFLIKMKEEFELPVLAVVDPDPFGIYLLSVYSRSMPDIKWLGVRPSDLDKYSIPEGCRLPMTERDMEYMEALLKTDFVKNDSGREKELKLLMDDKYKTECEALGSLGIHFLNDIYLPWKLQEMDWL
ncbi:DNA topoisomerase 6 subunit A [Orobanche minor]